MIDLSRAKIESGEEVEVEVEVESDTEEADIMTTGGTEEDGRGQAIETGVTGHDQTPEKGDAEDLDHGQENAQVPGREDDMVGTDHLQEIGADIDQEVRESRKSRILMNVEKIAGNDQETVVDRDHHTETINVLEENEVEGPKCYMAIADLKHS